MQKRHWISAALIALLVLAAGLGCAKKAEAPASAGVQEMMKGKSAAPATTSTPSEADKGWITQSAREETEGTEAEGIPTEAAPSAGAAGGMMGGPAGGGGEMMMKVDVAQAMPPSALPSPPAHRSHAAASTPAHVPSLSTPPSQEPALDKNAYYSSTYMGGSGQKERMEKLIEGGVLVGGKQVKLAAFSRDYSQAFAIPTAAALNLSADLERTKILTTGGKTYLQVGIQGIKKEAPRRPPLNVALVLDHSGSMADENKLEFVKQAAQRFVDGLSSQDTLALVVYDDAAQVAAPAAKVTNKARLKGIIGNLSVGGGTNIYDGLQSGYKEVGKHYSREAVNVVLLMSDGQVTVGIQDPNAFRDLVKKRFDDDITTTTIGVGLDYNEDLMLAVAQTGHGNYHFIKDGGSIDRILKQELQELTHIIAKALKVRIVLDRDVDLVKVFGSGRLSEEERREVRAEEKKVDQKIYEELGIAKDRQKDTEPGIKMFIPHFFLGDSHVVMLEIQVPPGRRTRHVADVYLKYKDLVFRENREPRVAVNIGYTAQKADMVASIQRPVKKNLLGFQTGETLLTAAQLIDAGRTAEAAKAINEQMTLLGVAAKEWDDRDLHREGQLMAKYFDVLRELGTRNVAYNEIGQYLSKSLSYSGYRMTR